MTQGVPNSEVADALRSIDIPPEMANSLALRDLLVSAAENGVPADAAGQAQNQQEVFNRLVLSHLECIQAVLQLDKNVRTTVERLNAAATFANRPTGQ